MNRSALTTLPLPADLTRETPIVAPDGLAGLEHDRSLPTSFRASGQIEQLITEMIGPENLAFLSVETSEQGTSSPTLKDLLKTATKFANSDKDREAVVELIERYVEILDFEGKLDLPRTSLKTEECTAISIVTQPHGESVYLISKSLEKMTEVIQKHTFALDSLREEISKARVSRFGSSSHVPTVAELDPISETVKEETGRGSPAASQRDRKHGLPTFNLGKFTLASVIELVEQLKDKAIFAASVALAILRESLSGGKGGARPGQNSLRNLLSKYTPGLKIFDVDIRGEGANRVASNALGLLSPRMDKTGFAQTGNPAEGQENGGLSAAQLSDALFRFAIDLGNIKSFFTSNPHIRGNLPRFFAKEAQIVSNREGKMERLDSFLSRTETGRELMSALYQPKSVPSTTEDCSRTVTIPIVPLLTTSLPVPPRMFITGLEYLNAKGERIEQADSNNIKACLAGGALVNAPIDARIVRYSVDADGRYRESESPHRPRSLTADEFQRFQNLLPEVDFDLGHENNLSYKAINQFHNPTTRFALANIYEDQRSWNYTMDAGVIELQRKAGTAFLESVYNTRAGICDSMSAVGAQIFGRTIGLSGIVLSGPVQDKGHFDLRVGHSITGSLSPVAVANSDLTEIASDESISLNRVPNAARRLLRDILNDKQATRSEIADVYSDLGDLMRGNLPNRFLSESENALKPRSLFQDYITSLIKSGDKANSSNDILEQVTGMHIWDLREAGQRANWIKLGFHLDEIADRMAHTGSGSELLWFIDRRLADVNFRLSKSSVVDLMKEKNISRIGAEQLQRSLKDDATVHLCSVIRQGGLNENEIRSLPAIVARLPFLCHLSIAEALHEADRDALTTKECTTRLLSGFLSYLSESGRTVDSNLALEFLPRLSKLSSSILKDIEPSERKQIAECLQQLLSGSYKLGSCFSGEKQRELRITALQNVAELLGVVYQVGGQYSSGQLIASLGSDYYAREGFELMLEYVPEYLQQALLGQNRSTAKQAIEASLADSFSNKMIGFGVRHNLLDYCAQLLPDLDLSGHSVALDPSISSLTKQFVYEHLGGKSRSTSGKYVVNWPSEETPASQLLFENDYSDSGAQGIIFLKALIGYKAISEKRAIEMWPSSDERQQIQTLLEKVTFRDGELTLRYNQNGWPLARMPELFKAISDDPDFSEQASLVRETIEWISSRKKIDIHPNQRPLLKIVEMLNGVPDQIRLTSDRRPSTVTALCEMAQRDLSDENLYEAIHAIAPRLIRPADSQNMPAHRAAVRDLARSLRQDENTPEGLKALMSFEPFTARPARFSNASIEGAIEAVTILDICNQFSFSLSNLRRSSTGTSFAQINNLMNDDGSRPENQIWMSHFPSSNKHSHYYNSELTTAIDRIQTLFRSSPFASRVQLRSPMLAWTLAEDGRTHVLGASGIPDDSRRYQPGDSPRNIDWKRSFRNGQEQLIVKVRKEQEERNLTAVVDLSLLAEEFNKLISIIESEKKTHKQTPAITLAKTAPALATLIHEAIVAGENRLKVDLLLTHHTVIRRENDCEALLLGDGKEAKAFHHELRNLAHRSSLLAKGEISLFGEKRYHPGTPLAHHDTPLRRASMVHFLPAPPYIRECDVIAPALKRQGHQVAQGGLPGLTNTAEKS